MKKYLPLALLAGLFLLCLWNAAAMRDCTGRWQEQLGGLDPLLAEENWPAIEDLLRDSYADWSARRLYLHVVSQHDAADSMEAMYRRCMAFAAAREPKELRAEAAELRERLRTLEETEQFSLGNIF